MTPTDFTVRRAREDDMAEVGRLGALLVRQHHGFDPKRFMAPGQDIEGGYAWFLGTQLRESDVLILVAERDSAVLGYLYAAVEPRSWKELREECGFVHDVVVDERYRKGGVGSALMDAAARWFTERRMPRVVLWTASQNELARRVFARIGFRPTMVEMTRELT